MNGYGWLILLVVILAGVAYGAYRLRRVLRKFSRAAFGTDTISEGLEAQKDELAQTQKSVSGMTRIYLPQIIRDFPEFHLDECKQFSDNTLKAYLAALSTGDIALLASQADALKNQVRAQLLDLERQNAHMHYERVRIHRTEITAYEKQHGRCRLVMQSAAAHIHFIEDEYGKIISGQKERLTQTKYNVEFYYVQDASKAAPDGTGVALTCSNCGAPVPELGSKACTYCGAAVREINLRVWRVERIYEVK